MNSSSSDRRSEGFFAGKGFYIVLFLCAAVIGVSAWVMAAGNRTMEKTDTVEVMRTEQETEAEAVIAPSSGRDMLIDETQFAPPEIVTEQLAEPTVRADESDAQSTSVEEAVYIWPVSGEVVREYTVSVLKYDETLRDWRTHRGIDIACADGTPVGAVRGGQVESIVSDSLYGVTLTIDHGDGVRSVYSNLAEETPVKVGDWVDPGVTIGTVGRSALVETAQESHLHFEMTVNGVQMDPMAYLAA